MSDTFRDRPKYPKARNEKHRANPYGLCRCQECSYGRRLGRRAGMVEKAKHKFRTAWKTGKRLIKGVYTD